ncbi:MAG: hypothetical protein ACOCQA_04030 [bacterium]
MVIDLDIEIIETSADYYTVNSNDNIYRIIRHYNITFAINFEDKDFIKDIKPITIKIVEMPDSTKELEKLLLKEFTKIFQSKGD